MSRFVDAHVSRAHRFALGRDSVGGTPYLAVPVRNRMVDYEEYYRLSDAEYATFHDDEAAAARFADACRRREHDDRLILQPGSDRGEPA